MFDTGKQYSLIVQGGGQKGAFAAGVLDSFIEQQFDPFSLYIGTSAGALNVSSYVTKQRGLGLDFILNYTTRDRFFDFNKFLAKKQPMDLDWAFDLVNQGEFPLDFERGKRYLGENKAALACITDVEELKDYYYPIFADNWFDVLKATCAIPMLYYNDIEFDGKKWVDGGVSATIPVEESYRRDIKNMVVISTMPASEKTLFHTSALQSIEKWKKELELGLDGHLSHLKLSGTKEKLAEFQKQFTEKLQAIRKDYWYMDFTNKIKLTDKAKLTRWLHEKEKFARLLDIQNKSIPFQFGGARHIEMLVAHYMNHAQAEQFISSPPEDVNLWHIQPEHELASKGLMSAREQILNDYQHGVSVGKAFIKQHHGIDTA